MMKFLTPALVFAAGLIAGLFVNLMIRRQANRSPGRFLSVELIIGMSFTVIWLLFANSITIWAIAALCLLTALMTAVAFIDYDQLVIPDKITFPGIVAGLGLSTLAPVLHGEFAWYNGLFSSLVGVVTGFVVMWGILITGKILFGRVRHKFSEPVKFSVTQPDLDNYALISLGKHFKYRWDEVFYRRWDKLPVNVTELSINGGPVAVENEFKMVHDGFVIDGTKREMHSVSEVSGKCTGAVVPREFVGFGNVKFVSMIGAFIGWQAVLVTVLSAFTLVAVLRSFLSGNKVPFSPFLAVGAFLFILFKYL